VREQRKVMRAEGKGWKRACWLLLAGVGLQFYFVQELVAAFAFFAIGFAAIAFVIMSLYMLQKGWEAAVRRFTNSEDLAESGLQAGRPAREMP
jgi:hypothetical protein